MVACTGGRACVEGYERKINKLKQDDGSWKTVWPGSKGLVPDSCQAPTFDMVKDLSLLFIACFKTRGWEYIDCVIMHCVDSFSHYVVGHRPLILHV
jgi:hypothetical protein